MPSLTSRLRSLADAAVPGLSDDQLAERRSRLPQLSPAEKAALVHELQRGIITPRAHEQLILEVFLSLEGEPFQEFKNLLNSGGDHHDLEHLVWEAIDDQLVRYALLDHIRLQAAAHPDGDLRILSDIDDTMRCMLHDDRYPRGTVYPGYVALVQALDRGGSADPGRSGDLTFVTARPSGPRGIIEQYTRNSVGIDGLPEHSVLGGSILNLHSKATIAARKIQNMDRDRQLFPECRQVFIGDSGQADAKVGAEMFRRDPDHLAGTLLHNVSALTPAQVEQWATQGVHAFDTYAGAAAHALRLGLVSQEQARAVADTTASDLEALGLDEARRAPLVRALERERALIG